jgi:hypothetical protein
VYVREFTLYIVLLIGTYAALMFYAGLTTVISYGARMFVPVIPLLAVLLAIAVNRWLPPAQGTLMRRAPALAAAMGLYLIVNAISYANPLVDRATVVRSQLAGRTSAGPSIGDLIEATGRGVVVANSGQALGFLLDRPTVSLVGPHYSNIEWDEAALREVVSRYAASVVVMTGPSDAQPLSTDLIPSAFIGSLTRGEAPPWLRVVGRSGPVTVYVPLASP